MTTPARDHEQWADSVGAWLLGALPEDEAAGFKRHLDECAVCREDAAGLRVAVDALPASVSPQAPPPALKERIMAVVEAEASLLQAAGPESDRPQRRSADWRSWVLGIVHHRTIDALRRNLVHDRRRTSAEGLEERQEAPERTDVEVARREEARSVRAALETLPDQQTKVIELAYFGGFTHTQIAEMLDMPIGTVKGRMRLGLEKLRRQLAGEYGGELAL
jgi:RNA polymerase sigma factor (sigma-70 family)